MLKLCIKSRFCILKCTALLNKAKFAYEIFFMLHLFIFLPVHRLEADVAHILGTGYVIAGLSCGLKTLDLSVLSRARKNFKPKKENRLNVSLCSCEWNNSPSAHLECVHVPKCTCICLPSKEARSGAQTNTSLSGYEVVRPPLIVRHYFDTQNRGSALRPELACGHSPNG